MDLLGRFGSVVQVFFCWNVLSQKEWLEDEALKPLMREVLGQNWGNANLSG